VSPGGEPGRLSLFHRVFDWCYPAIRFAYERVMGHAWFSEITPRLWLGGAPTYERDYRALLDHGITAVVDLRAERTHEPEVLEAHGIAARQYRVPDIEVPDAAVLTDAVAWISEQLDLGRTVLVHCAKGRGRSATVLAAYLMAAERMGFDEVEALLTSKRSLVKLQDRHRRVLEAWIASRRATADPPA
jgi:protein-tyrosine phosphatase